MAPVAGPFEGADCGNVSYQMWQSPGQLRSRSRGRVFSVAAVAQTAGGVAMAGRSTTPPCSARARLHTSTATHEHGYGAISPLSYHAADGIC